MQNVKNTPITRFIIFNMYLLYIGKFIIAKTGISGPPIVNYYLILTTLWLVLPFANKYSKYIIGYTVITIGYCTFKSLVYNMPYVETLIQYSSSLFIMLMCIYLHEHQKADNLRVNSIKKHFYIIFTIEILLSVAQYLYQPIYDYFHIVWSWRGQIIGDVDYSDFWWYKEPSHIIGTFFKNVSFAGYISIFTIIGVLDCLIYPKECLKFRYLIVSAGIIGVFMTGIRAPFLVLSFMILMAIRTHNKKYFKQALLTAIALVVFFTGYSITNQDSSIYRIQLGIIAIFSGNLDLIYAQTIGYSLYMIPYFLQEPICGISLGDAYQVGQYNLAELSSTDIQLMFILCEMGIIGLLILLWPLNNLGRILNDQQSVNNIRIVLFTCYALTIIDDFLFNWEAKFLLALSVCLLGHSVKYNGSNNSIA